MTDESFADFLAALGQEFCEALSPPIPWGRIVPQDAYEVWLRAFRQRPSPGRLAQLTDAQRSHLRDECERYFECPDISAEHIRTAVARTLARWPATDS